ncbi:MAG: sugar phosphate isomerase/epimerase [Gemmatimonadota bacterium]|nr:sugar phosphate isomerase/epimerase [Gemmatimonadota bacterium]
MTDSRVPRRTFLTTAAATVAGATVGVSRLARAAESSTPSSLPAARTVSPSAVRLGIASYSLRKFPLDKSLEMMKTLRTPFVNFKSVHVPYEKSPLELAALRKQIEAAGFQIVGAGTITFSKDTDEDVRHYFDYCKAAGVPLITAMGPAVVMPRVEKFAKQYDIKVAIHNHGPEDKNFPSPYDVLKLVKNMDPRMGLCIDVGHTVRTGTNVVKAVLDAGPRLLDMHVKDLADLTAKDSQVIVGEGAIPIPDLFRALDTIHYGGYVNLEYEIDADDPLPGMKQSFAYMRGVLAGLAPAGTRTAAKGG